MSSGAADRNRTYDLLLTMETLFRLSYNSMAPAPGSDPELRGPQPRVLPLHYAGMIGTFSGNQTPAFGSSHRRAHQLHQRRIIFFTFISHYKKCAT